MSSPELLAVYGGKGGIGKTTTALNLAWYFGSKEATGLADAEYQESATTLAAGMKVTPPYRWLGANLASNVADLDTIVVDMPPSIAEARPLLERARLIVCPFTLRDLDTKALTKSLLHDLKGLPVVAFMSRVTHAQRNAALSIRNVLEGAGLLMLQTTVREYVTAHDMANRHGVPILHPEAGGSNIALARADAENMARETYELWEAM